jgi:hypothetical protein
MNQLNMRDLQQHVQIVGWLLIVTHAVFLAIGGGVFFLLAGIGAVSGDEQALAVLGVVATSMAVLFAGLGLPGVIAGYGLLKGRTWGRVLAVVVAVLGLVNFPLGTAISLYVLWVLLQESANSYFAAPAARAA